MSVCKLISDQQELSSWVNSATGPIDLAVAFWGNEAISALGLRNENRPTRILLELSAGGTNPDVVRKLLSFPHIDLKQYPRLHAKAYITESMVAIGSTNASANGLDVQGHESSRWHELCCLIDDPGTVCDAKQWFDNMWQSALPISEGDLASAEQAWKERQRLRPMAASQANHILTAAMANPAAFRNRGIYVVVSTEDLDKQGHADAAALERESGRKAFGWQGWKDIPRDATLICFTDYKDAKIRWDKPKVCYSPRQPIRYRTLTVVTKTSLGDGFKLDPIKIWRCALERAKERCARQWESEKGLCLDIGDFAAEFRAQAGQPQP